MTHARFAVPLALGLLACSKGPESSPSSHQKAARLELPPPEVVEDPSWFGEGVALCPDKKTGLSLVWSAPGLDLRHQGVDLRPVALAEACTKGLSLTESRSPNSPIHVAAATLEDFVTEGLRLSQEGPPPPEAPLAYRCELRMLRFHHEYRVGAKIGQVVANGLLGAVYMVGRSGGPMVAGVSGHHYQLRYQLRLVDAKSGQTVLGIQSDLDYLSLAPPRQVALALWTLQGGQARLDAWWPSERLSPLKNEEAWSDPGFDPSQFTLHCAPWAMPEGQAWRSIPDLLIQEGERRAAKSHHKPALHLSSTSGDIEVEGLWYFQHALVKLSDPRNGKVLALFTTHPGRKDPKELAQDIVEALIDRAYEIQQAKVDAEARAAAQVLGIRR